MNTTSIARLISRVFGPLSCVPIGILYLLVFETGLSSDVQMWVGPIMLATYYLLPLSVILYFSLTHRISDIDITDRKEREHILILVLVSVWVGGLISLRFELTDLYLRGLFFNLVTLTIAAGVTFKEKISLHMVEIVGLCLLLVQIMGWEYLISLVVLPMVAWARLHLKKHN